MTRLSFARFAQAGSGAVVSQAVSLACVPILFRFYSPEAFGLWAVTMAVVLGAGTIATLRYELATVIEREHEPASVVFWLSLLVGVTLGVLLSALVWLVGYWLSSPIDAALKAPFSAVCAWIILTAIGQAMQGWLLRSAEFAASSQIQVCNALVVNAVQLLGAWLGGSPLWLVAGSIAGQTAAVLLATVRVAEAPPARFRGEWNALREAALRHRRFPLFSAPFTLLSIARERASVIVLAAMLSPAQVGWYSQAWRLVNIPVGLSGGALRPVMFHAAAEQGLAGQESRTGRMLLAITLLGAPWLGVLMYDPQAAFGAALGPAWHEAGTLAAILAVPAFFFALSNWMDRFLDLQGRQDLNLWTELVTAVLSVGVLWLALDRGHGLFEATVAQALVLAVCYLGFIAITFRTAGFRMMVLYRIVALSIVLPLLFGLLTVIVGNFTTSLTALICGAAAAAAAGSYMAARALKGWE